MHKKFCQSIIVLFLSFGMILAGCGVQPASNQLPTTKHQLPSLVLSDGAWTQTVETLNRQGINIGNVLSTTDNSAIVSTDTTGVVVNILFNDTQVDSVVVMHTDGVNYKLDNFALKKSVTGSIQELEAFAKQFKDNNDIKSMDMSASNKISEIFRGNTYTDEKNTPVEARCSACRSERNARNADAARFAAATTALLLAIGALGSCGATLGATCLAAVAAWTLASAAEADASTQLALSQKELEDCIRSNC